MISNKVGIPQDRLTSILKQKFQMTIPQYINHIKINAAKELLKNTDKSIKEIFLSVGFDDTSHFNHKFKDIVGLSPSEFRGKYQTLDNNKTNIKPKSHINNNKHIDKGPLSRGK
jgi:AraC-like DNA-binding protein